ncbi:MAG: hypothetical protein FWH14_02980 [Oscillospiraceae bacterium]|nr:hypothetical protein [Oscillospiraceae bacterium]
MQAPFPSGEGCRRSGGGVCRDDRPRSSVVIANSVGVLASPFGRGVMR